jgi:TatD DNase family protein
MKHYPYIDLHTHQVQASNAEKVAVVNILAANPLPDNPKTNLSCGIHPWQIEAGNISALWESLDRVMANKQLVAIGEAGFDTMIDSPLEMQQMIFEKQAALAVSHHIPLIIHCVKAYAELLESRKRHPDGIWIVHGFDGNIALANQLIGKRIYLSIGAALMNSKRKITKALPKIPPEYLFFETDDQTDFTIEAIYQQAAAFTGMELEALKAQIFRNFAACFPKIN